LICRHKRFPFLVSFHQSTVESVLQDQRFYYCLHFQHCLLHACILVAPCFAICLFQDTAVSVLLLLSMSCAAALRVRDACQALCLQCCTGMYSSFSCVLQANSEVSALLGRIPSAVGYQPTLATDLGTLQERITTTKKGSITSVQVGGHAHLHSIGAGSWKCPFALHWCR